MYVQSGEITHDFIHTFLAVKTLCIYLLFVSSFSLSLSLSLCDFMGYFHGWSHALCDFTGYFHGWSHDWENKYRERISTERKSLNDFTTTSWEWNHDHGFTAYLMAWISVLIRLTTLPQRERERERERVYASNSAFLTRLKGGGTLRHRRIQWRQHSGIHRWRFIRFRRCSSTDAEDHSTDQNTFWIDQWIETMIQDWIHDGIVFSDLVLCLNDELVGYDWLFYFHYRNLFDLWWI